MNQGTTQEWGFCTCAENDSIQSLCNSWVVHLVPLLIFRPSGPKSRSDRANWMEMSALYFLLCHESAQPETSNPLHHLPTALSFQCIMYAVSTLISALVLVLGTTSLLELVFTLCRVGLTTRCSGTHSTTGSRATSSSLPACSGCQTSPFSMGRCTSVLMGTRGYLLGSGNSQAIVRLCRFSE